ncbi:MAG: hypothetical protein DRN66_04270 [Candidatus Nanohalarchaeota archaeon]|nr:MAG: hypothetical protein DRN66_04270 [Candidatus Nanohaloarchaeota archaeon]
MQEIVFDVSSIDCNPFVDEFGEEKVKEYNNKYPDSKELNVKSALKQKVLEYSAKKNSITVNITTTTTTTNLLITEEKPHRSAANSISDEALVSLRSTVAVPDSSKPRQAQTMPAQIKTEVVKKKLVSLPAAPKSLVEKPVAEESEFERKQIIDMNDILRGLKENEGELEKQLPSLKKLYTSKIIEREEYDFLVQNVVAKIKELDKKIDYEREVQKIKKCKENIEDSIAQELLKGELKDKTQHTLNSLKHLYNDGIICRKMYVDGRNQVMIRERKVNELIKKIEGILDNYVEESKKRTKEAVDTNRMRGNRTPGKGKIQYG